MKPETDAFFISERRSPLSRMTAWLAIRTYGALAGLPVEATSKVYTGLFRTPEYSAHHHGHGDQSGTVREVVAVDGLLGGCLFSNMLVLKILTPIP
jgi:hypothetical protein